MKIIADMGVDKFLVEATGHEIANIIGVYHPRAAPSEMTRNTTHSDGIFHSSSYVFKVGATFDISPAYQWLSKFKERRAETLKSTAIMRAFLYHVDGNIPEIVTPIVLTPEDVKAAEKVEVAS
jgi:uncharacterized membrane protein